MKKLWITQLDSCRLLEYVRNVQKLCIPILDVLHRKALDKGTAVIID